MVRAYRYFSSRRLPLPPNVDLEAAAKEGATHLDGRVLDKAQFVEKLQHALVVQLDATLRGVPSPASDALHALLIYPQCDTEEGQAPPPALRIA